MMTTAILLHGICDREEYFDMDFPSPSNAHWLPWLQKQFLRADCLCQTPEMPTPYAPEYDAWCNVFEQFTWTDDTIIVAHSAGCGFILKWLHENRDRRIGKLVFVAPYLDPEKEQGDFLQIELDRSIENQMPEMHLLYSSDDDEDIQVTTKKLLNAYPKIKLYEYDNMGHFTFSETGSTFLDLWNIAKPE